MPRVASLEGDDERALSTPPHGEQDLPSTLHSSTRADSGQLLVGHYGQNYLSGLSKSSNPQQDIAVFQTEAGLNMPQSKAPLEFLDLLGVSRAATYSSALELMKGRLEEEIPLLSEQQLEGLLTMSFPYIAVPEMQSIPIKVITAMKNIPKGALEKLIRIQVGLGNWSTISPSQPNYNCLVPFNLSCYSSCL